MEVENDYADGGDSGGPVYYGNTAYGLHQGWVWNLPFTYNDVFSRADKMDDAMSVSVRTIRIGKADRACTRPGMRADMRADMRARGESLLRLVAIERHSKVKPAGGNLMINSPGLRGFLPRGPGRKIVAMVAVGLLFFAAWSSLNGNWSFLRGFEWRSGVRVTQAELRSPDRFVLNVATCNGNPEVVLLRETDIDVQVKVVSSRFPFSGGGDDCLDQIEVQLQQPFGDRTFIDKDTGQPVSVSTVNPLPDHGEGPPPPEVAPPEIGDSPNEAELQDLQRVADQKGISLQEAIDRYAWNDNFSLAVAEISEAFPAAFAGAEIVDTGSAWIAFAGPAPEAALDIIDLFRSSHRGVSVEVRSGEEFTEVELQKAIEAAHYAVYESPEVRDATTSFDSATGQITTVVLLESTASDSAFDDLRARALKAVTDATRVDILDSITYSVVRSNSEVLSGKE